MCELLGLRVGLTVKNASQRQQGAMSERSDNDPSSYPKRTVRDCITRAATCGCLDSPRPADSDKELRNSAAGRASRMEMQEILKCSNTALRRQEERQAETLENNRRLQNTFARAAAILEPFPGGPGRSPPPPAYNPLLGNDSTPVRPNAPFSLGEASRDGVELPAAPGRVVTAAGPMGTATQVYRNPNRFMFTPIPMTPLSEKGPNNPFREYWKSQVVK